MPYLQGPPDARERGAGDWQHYQSPKEILSQVAARERLPGPAGPPQQGVGTPTALFMHHLTLLFATEGN